MPTNFKKRTRKIFKKIIFVLLVCLILPGNLIIPAGQARAASTGAKATTTTAGSAPNLSALPGHDAKTILQRRANKITQAQREAAAASQQKSQAAPLAAPLAVPAPGGTPNYFGPEPNWAYSPTIRKFVDSLPGLGATKANNLGQYLPIATPDTITYPGSDYYEISLKEYTEKMHTDLPATRLRGYVQTNKGTDPVTNLNTVLPAPIHYLGPVIIASKDRPVRIKFTNMLPTGAGGNLFLPVDATVMGAGKGPLDINGNSCDPMMAPMPGMPACESYKQNRATLHLHGGLTPWISDGTPHQWTTPAGESTVYPKGVSVQNVPDMPDPGPGSLTFFYSNQQSARLMFYHDHAYGITRLNVYAGEAAAYLLTDQTEQNLIASGAIPAEQVPLIIQDKTFVNANTVLSTDPTWNWGSTPGTPHTGDLWFPHVYMTNQNPNDPTGVNPLGRWDYGPWFWPVWPATIGPKTLANGTVVPGVPDLSMTMEAFMDTPLVNGTAYPYFTAQPKAYRFRVLNASDDRFWNLGFYVADSAVTASDGRANTEVKMIPATPGTVVPAYWPTLDSRAGGIPDPATAGPSIVQIGTEGGFLPAPVNIPSTPIGFDRDTRSITVGNIKEHGLLLGPAERADIIVDFSAFAGKTLILYNDAPAPAPATDPRLDYYTGNPNLTSTGGAASTLPGFGPNTRTVMQIRVAAGAPTPFNPAALNTALPAAFAASQAPIVVPQNSYNAAYNGTFPATNHAGIQATSLTFTPLNSATPVTMPLQPKAIAEEFETPYGRMQGYLGVEVPFTNGLNQTTIWYDYQDPSTENINDSVTVGPVTAGDGTQLWKVTHNGVDTHAIHFHLFDVQVVNRVDWAGVVKPPDPNELGWKDTVRMNPLEDIIVALRPVAPKTPFGVPDSVRLLDPTMPVGSTNFKGVDTSGNPITVTNQMTNFRWEYMWHCHLLSHEEMDMMRPIIFNVATAIPTAPGALNAVMSGAQVNLTWTDPTPAGGATTLGNPANEIGFKVERATVTGGTPGPYAVIATAQANATAYSDATVANGTSYSYRITAFNVAGSASSNVKNVTATVAQGTSVIALKAGWNLVTLPAQGATAFTADSFGVLAGADVVTAWLSPTQAYSSHVVGVPLNNFTLTNGMGFFVHVTTAKNVSITGTPFPQVLPTIGAGWNAVGYNGATATTANAYGLQFAGADLVAKFDSTTQQWVTHIMNFPLNDFAINPGDGIFIHRP